jgi:hypothetical protein
VIIGLTLKMLADITIKHLTHRKEQYTWIII